MSPKPKTVSFFGWVFRFLLNAPIFKTLCLFLSYLRMSNLLILFEISEICVYCIIAYMMFVWISKLEYIHKESNFVCPFGTALWRCCVVVWKKLYLKKKAEVLKSVVWNRGTCTFDLCFGWVDSGKVGWSDMKHRHGTPQRTPLWLAVIWNPIPVLLIMTSA